MDEARRPVIPVTPEELLAEVRRQQAAKNPELFADRERARARRTVAVAAMIEHVQRFQPDVQEFSDIEPSSELAGDVIDRYVATGDAEERTMYELVLAKAITAADVPRAVELVRFEADETRGWALAEIVRLNLTRDAGLVAQLRAVLQDTSLGIARQPIAMGVGAIATSNDREWIEALLTDPDINGHVVVSLRALACPESVPALKALEDDDRAWVRNEVRRAIRKLER